MTVFYTLVEMEPCQLSTMPPVMSTRPVRLHAAADREDGQISAICSYPVVPDRDVPKRDLPFSARWKTVVQGTPECVACAAAIHVAA